MMRALLFACLVHLGRPFTALVGQRNTISASRSGRRMHSTACRATVTAESLGGALFRQVFGGLQKGVQNLSGQVSSAGPFTSTDVAAGRQSAARAEDRIKSINERAQSGVSVTTPNHTHRDTVAGRGLSVLIYARTKLLDTYDCKVQVTFEDFLEVGRTFKALNGKIPGGELSAQQIDDTFKKIEKHEKIVLAMTDEERAQPQLILDDLENIAEKCPRIQRLSRDSGVAERDVALFCAEFEAMRVSTKRIAAGEDPNEVNNEIGSSNRAQRRAAKKAQKKRR